MQKTVQVVGDVDLQVHFWMVGRSLDPIRTQVSLLLLQSLDHLALDGPDRREENEKSSYGIHDNDLVLNLATR